MLKPIVQRIILLLARTRHNAVYLALPPQEADLAVTPYTEPQATVCGVVESQDYGVRQDADLQIQYLSYCPAAEVNRPPAGGPV